MLPLSVVNARTPFYLYNGLKITGNFNRYKTSLDQAGNYLICYAVKANHNGEILDLLRKLGAGADVVSGAELQLCLDQGFPPNRIIFSGVGKTTEELRQALTQGILQLNVESAEELEEINEIVLIEGIKSVPIALRVNTDTDADTHEFLKTSRNCDKFGIHLGTAVEVIESWKTRYSSLEFGGLTCHVGSGISDLGVYREAFTKLVGLLPTVRNAGLQLKTLDFGGGIGIPYDGVEEGRLSIEDFTSLIVQLRAEHAADARILLEPGRSVVGNAGALITEVVRVKANPTGLPMAIVDAGMNNLIRPSLYGATHRVRLLGAGEEEGNDLLFDVVGPVCESADVFGRGMRFPGELRKGDKLAILDAGAYGAVMASGYNCRPPAPEILLMDDDGSFPSSSFFLP